MFQMMFRRAQAAVETTIEHTIIRIFTALPFLIAIGFVTCALAYRLTAEFGPEIGNLMMAALFVVVGLLGLAMSTVVKTPTPIGAPAAIAAPVEAALPEQPADLTGADKELITAALGTIAPLATPYVMRQVMKNLPLLAVVSAALFVVTRNGGQTASDHLSTRDLAV